MSGDEKATSRLVWPTVLRLRPGWLWPLIAWTPYIAVYQVVNRFPVFEPQELPLGVLDQTVPFMPALLPVYVAYLPMYWWTVRRSESDERLNRIFYVTHLQLAISVAFFVLYPVRMPRDLYYQGAVYNWADVFWRWFDAPNNCFPSLHASNCATFIWFNWRRPWWVLHTIVALAIIASAVLVKQHYVVDIVAGVAVFAVTCWIMARIAIAPPRGGTAG